MEIRKEMEALAAETLDSQFQERPELAWLKKQYGQFMRREGISSKSAADIRLYERIYNCTPQKESDLLKIRYWRTGRHLPANYSQCRMLGQGLGLGEKELRYLMQGYFDSCDSVFSTESDRLQADYQERRSQMELLVDRYLARIPQKRLELLNIPQDALRHNFRHLYYTDALQYVCPKYSRQKSYLTKHITSINYDSELNRNLMLLGVVPRRTMIRHLFILCMPDIRLDFINQMLSAFGYLPLQEAHTLRTGERLDLLLIRLLQWYEKAARHKSPKERRLWMQLRLQALDEVFARQNIRHLRFMLFKALETQ